jgi:hypothetical protein
LTSKNYFHIVVLHGSALTGGSPAEEKKEGSCMNGRILYSIALVGFVCTVNGSAKASFIPPHSLPKSIEEADLEQQRRIDAVIDSTFAKFMNKRCDSRHMQSQIGTSADVYKHQGRLLDFNYDRYDEFGAPKAENRNRIFPYILAGLLKYKDLMDKGTPEEKMPKELVDFPEAVEEWATRAASNNWNLNNLYRPMGCCSEYPLDETGRNCVSDSETLSVLCFSDCSLECAPGLLMGVDRCGRGVAGDCQFFYRDDFGNQ